jgi:outer membrane protein
MTVSTFALALSLVLQGNPLSLSDVIRETRSHSAEVRVAQEDVKAARARVGQQNSRRLPQIGISGSATRFDDVSTLNFAGQKIEVVPDHLEALTLQLDQTLDFANQIGTAVSQAKLSALASEYGLASVEADTSLQATTAYYDLLRAEQSVRVAQASLDAYQEQLKTNTRLFEGGVGQKIDVYRAQSQVADAERELVRRQNGLNSARSRLNDLVGRPLDEQTTVASGQDEAVEALDRPALIQQALDRRTEILASATEIRAAEKGIKLARSSTDPRFSVGLAGNYYPTTSFQYVRQSTAAITLGVTIPVYEGGLARERTREARAIVDAAKARADRVRRDVALQVQNAALDVETAQKRRTAADVAVTAASAARDLAQRRYEAQVGLYLEVTDAQAALTQAQAAQVDATYDLLTAQARLTRAVGQPLTK